MILIINPKHSTVPAARKKINSIPAEIWTSRYIILYSLPQLNTRGHTLLKSPKPTSAGAACFLIQVDNILPFIFGFYNIASMFILVCMFRYNNQYIYYLCILFHFCSGLSQRFQRHSEHRPFLSRAIITGFVLCCLPIFQLSPMSSLSLLCLEIQCKVHYEYFIPCYVCSLMSKSSRPALCDKSCYEAPDMRTPS